MKWVILGAFCGAVALLILNLATKPVETYDGVVQLVWASDDNPARQEQMRLFKAWHLKTYGEKIDIRLDPANGGRIKVATQAAAGVGPDVFDMYSAIDLERMVKSGIILDVTDDAKRMGFSPEIYWSGIRGGFVYDGRQYAVPDNAGAYLILYNKKIFDREGIPYPDVKAWTWNEFIALAKKFTHKRPDGSMQFGMLEIDPMILIYQNGGRRFSAEGTRCVLDSPEAIGGLQFYKDLRYKYHVMPTASDIASLTTAGGWGGSVNVFAGGRFAMSAGARWWYVSYARDTRTALASGAPAPYDLGVAPLPHLKYAGGVTQLRATAISRVSTKKQYALRFLQFLASEPYNRQVNSSFDAYAPVIKFDTGPHGIAEGTPPPGLESANSNLWVESIANSRSLEVSPFIPPYRVDTLWKEMLDRLNAKEGITAEQVLRDLTKAVNAEIEHNIDADPKLKARYEAARAKEEGR